MKIIQKCILQSISGIVIFAGCNNNGFSGNEMQKPVARAESKSTNVSGADSKPKSDVPEIKSDKTLESAAGSKANIEISADQNTETIKKCLSLWGNHPFKKVTGANYKRLASPVAFLGLQIGKIDDTFETKEDFLIVVDVGVNIGSQVTYNLMNPKGWYCLKANITAGVDSATPATTKINLHCSAKLAKSDLALNVDSQKGTVGINQGNGAGQFGIAIDGTVTLNQTATGGGSCGK